MIRAVLFDLDGTLLDRRQSLVRFIHDQYNRYISDFRNISTYRQKATITRGGHFSKTPPLPLLFIYCKLRFTRMIFN